MELSRCVHCHRNPRAGWKRASRHRAFQMGVSLLRVNSRGNVGAANTAGWLPDRTGKATTSWAGGDLAAAGNFYSLKTEMFPAGGWRQVIGQDAIGWAPRWAFCPMLTQEACWWRSGASWPWLRRGLFSSGADCASGLHGRSHTCSLGLGLHTHVFMELTWRRMEKKDNKERNCALTGADTLFQVPRECLACVRRQAPVSLPLATLAP